MLKFNKKLLLIPGSIIILTLISLLPTSKPLKIEDLPAGDIPQLDWTKIKLEATQLLQNYLKIQTVRGNEDQAHRWIADILRQEGIEPTLINLPGMPGRSILIAEIGPKDKSGGVILASHSDVVDVTPEEWNHPPFSGKLVGNRIWGRGAVDMKGMGIMELMTFLTFKRKNIPLKSPLMLLILPDEETGSKGAKYLVEHFRFRLKNYSYLLNEGGMGTKDMAIPNSKIFNLQYAEKGMLWLTVKAQGISGHGSTPRKEYALKNLMNFLLEVDRLDEPLTVTEETESFFYQLGTISKFPNSFILKRLWHPLLRKMATPILHKNRHLRALTTNTRSITGVKTDEGLGHNVIVPEAYAKLDMRLLPNTTPEIYFKKLQKIADTHQVELTIRDQKQPSKSPISSKFFKTLAAVATRKVTGSIVTPFQSTGLTDNAVLRQTHLQCYGLIPALFTNQDIDMMHGKNESISQENLTLGTAILFETVLEMNR
jgi:acetylornithine deacetylase/succinyl-diaminopimelate desuccinylase-like protein